MLDELHLTTGTGEGRNVPDVFHCYAIMARRGFQELLTAEFQKRTVQGVRRSQLATSDASKLLSLSNVSVLQSQ